MQVHPNLGDSQSGRPTAQARATVGFFGSSYFWTLDLGGSGCDAANPGNVLFSLTPLAAVKADGKWLITEVALAAAPDEGTGCGGTGSGAFITSRQPSPDHRPSLRCCASR